MTAATMSFLHFVFLGCVFAAGFASDADDLKLQQAFGNLEGVVADFRDQCFQDSSITLQNLKMYEKADDVSEDELCFYKCFYEKVGFIDENGKIVIGDLSKSPEIKDKFDGNLDELNECIEGLDRITTCSDLRKSEKCFRKAIV